MLSSSRLSVKDFYDEDDHDLPFALESEHHGENFDSKERLASPADSSKGVSSPQISDPQKQVGFVIKSLRPRDSMTEDESNGKNNVNRDKAIAPKETHGKNMSLVGTKTQQTPGNPTPKDMLKLVNDSVTLNGINEGMPLSYAMLRIDQISKYCIGD